IMTTDLLHPTRRSQQPDRSQTLAQPRRKLESEVLSQSLLPGQRLRLTTPEGTLLLEIIGTAGAPQICLPHGQATLHVSGKLNISADQLTLESRTRDMKLLSPKDVIVKGRTIRLN